MIQEINHLTLCGCAR